MTQNKKPAGKVSVKLLCVLSGDGESWAAGTIVEVDAVEAERLIDLGAAETATK